MADKVVTEKTGEGDDKVEEKILIGMAFGVMLNRTADMIFIKDADLKYVTASMPFVKLVGKSSVGEIVGHTDLEIFEDENLAKRYIEDDKKLLSEGKDLIDYIEPIPDDGGKARYGSTSKYILSDDKGKMIGILGITRDITKDYAARQHYQQELRYLFELPADTFAVSYIDIDSWRIISQRRQLIGDGTLQSCFSVAQLCDAAIKSILDETCDAAKFYRNFNADYLHKIYASGKSTLSFAYERALSDGSVRWISNEIRFLVDVDSGHLCAMLTAKDIDAEMCEKKNLIVAAKMDKMTMLLNRETTMDCIRQVLEKEKESTHALFMLDVDNFKRLNDTQGHQTGDKFLIAFASEIRKNFRGNDIVGRIGGDEFFALMKNVSDDEQVERKAKTLLAVIRKVCEEYPDVPLSGSIGIALYPEDGRTLEELYARADMLLYQAKRKGKNQYILN